MSHDVFISYSSHDKPIADGVCATLEQNGLRCWIAPRDIVPGAEWSTSIIQALEESRAFVLVLSHSANESNQIKREVERAVHNALPIIPYRIEDVMPEDALEYFISTPHWMDAFTPPVEAHAQDLADALKRLLGDSASPAPRAPPAPPPAPPAAPPVPVRPSPLTQPMVLALAAGVVVVAAIGFLALRPKPPDAPAAASGAPSFVGDWTVASVQWAPSVASGYNQTTLGELFAGELAANKTHGAFSVNATGGFQTVVEVDDSGSVAHVGDSLLFRSNLGATAIVAATPLSYARAAMFGAQTGEVGILLTGLRRIPEPWVGLADPGAAGGPLRAFAGSWRSGGWPTLPDGQVWTASMTITPTGAYRLQLFQKVGGSFSAGSDGQWSANVLGAGGGVSSTNGGRYVFNGLNEVSMSSPQGTTVWARQGGAAPPT